MVVTLLLPLYDGGRDLLSRYLYGLSKYSLTVVSSGNLPFGHRWMTVSQK